METGESDFSQPAASKWAVRCVLKGNLKVFSRAISALSKLGADLYIEPSRQDGLVLRAKNQAQSAYGCFLFTPDFFVEFEGGDDANTSTADGEETALCKISMKCALSVFKGAQFMEKSTCSCVLMIDPRADNMSVEMALKHGVIKVYKIPFLTCGPGLRPMFDKSKAENCVIDNSKCIMGACGNFGAATGDVTFCASANELLMRNNLPSESDRSRVVKTEITLSKQDFERFVVNVSADVTICLKELKAMLMFADALNMPVSLYFDSPGKPFICSLETDLAFIGDFVISSLVDSPDRGLIERPVAESQGSTVNLNMAGGSEQLHSSSVVDRERAHRAEDSVSRVCRSQTALEPLLSDAQASSSKNMPEFRTEEPPAHTDDDRPPAEDDDAILDTVPGTPPPPPPNKRFRQMFLGISQPTLHASQMFKDAQILAPDSDPEEP